MPLCCGNNTVEIQIANGSKEEIFCRVICDKILVTRREGGGDLNVAGLAGAKRNIGIEYEHITGGQDGYTPIWPKGTMTFEMEGKPVYLTILSETNKKICINHKVNQSRNVIVSKGFHLKEAEKNSVWTDTSGKSHTLSEPRKHEEQELDDNPVDMFDEAFGNYRNESDTLEVTIANRCEEIIYCRIKGLQNESTPTGYTPIAPRSFLKFTPSEQHVYMTIISKSNTLMCVNHEINTSRGFIISHGKFLKDAARGKIWIDTNGKDHEKEDAHDTVSNIENFDAGNLFEIKTLTSAL